MSEMMLVVLVLPDSRSGSKCLLLNLLPLLPEIFYQIGDSLGRIGLIGVLDGLDIILLLLLDLLEFLGLPLGEGGLLAVLFLFEVGLQERVPLRGLPDLCDLLVDVFVEDVKFACFLEFLLLVDVLVDLLLMLV